MTEQLTASPGDTPTFRDFIRQVSPPWLRFGNNEKLLYALAVQADAFADALTASVKMRFPNYYSADSLPTIGRERRITRGLQETDVAYGARLQRWLDDHRVRGGPYALLQQLHTFYSPNTFAVDLIYRNGRRFRMDAAGNITRDVVPSFAPDTDPARWARWWLFMYSDQFTPPLSAQQLADARLVPAEWNAAHCLGYLVFLPTGAEMWNFPLGRTWNEPGTWNTTQPVVTSTVEG